ncbi:MULTISPECIES: efflux RND transporter permease subunit [unclassified Coleofasciculus]|uniref:efflux RND transporter permease subunit n=1 Tax=unclassified Coleofasciculus TaxID=2692782 RepID=UPI00188010B6|nr:MULTISPECIES: efflux RND transporter permease subunit [unclassified Coleofasciculus]MBE9127508.1 efflux RND transporter permease subunit [Coleofasciculus sp. LEGE 07081]MBE9150830.1 efflux RND transporter permease subunit [Coleofasciculus sp. LEGE 07092]
MVQPTPQKSIRERLNISRLAIAHPWLTVGFWIAVTVAGLFAFSSLKYALFPDITFPVVVVQAQAPLETALETEETLTKPIEQQLQSLKGIGDYRSSTYSGRAIFNLGFDVGTNLEETVDRVETAIQDAQLPSETTFEVIPLNLNESATISYAIQSDRQTLDELIQIAQGQIIPPIAQLPGVLRVDLLGSSQEPENQETPSDAEANINYPATLVRFNGQDAVAFRVIKRGDANTLDVVSQVQKAVQKLQSDFPDVQLVLAETQADYIREATQSTIDALLLAIVLAVLVIYPFLRNVRATLITALAIPISLLGTCIVMAIAGFNLETITLLALALVIGIIVDDAIVDVENIARHIEAGESPRQAAITGTDEIGLTVTASTLTIAAVFLPVALMEGTIGQFFKPFALTISAAVLISLLVARTLSPVLAVWWLRRRGDGERGRLRRERSVERRGAGENSVETRYIASGGFLGVYQNLLRWSLNHRTIVVGLALISFVAGVALIPLIPKGFIPKLDRGEFNVTYTSPLPQLSNNPAEQNALNPFPSEESLAPTPEIAPSPSPESSPADNGDSLFGEGSFDWLTDLVQSPTRILLNRSRTVADQIEAVLLDSPAVKSVFTIVGFQGEPNKGKLHIELDKAHEFTTAQVQDQIRAALPDIDNVTISIEDIQFVDMGDEKPLQVALVGEDLAVLSDTVRELKTRIEKLPGFVDVAVTGLVEADDTINKIEHLNSQRVAFLTANLSQGQTIGNATDQVISQAQAVLPPSVTLDLEGESALSSHVLESFGWTLALSVSCMLLVLILPFGRLLEPLVVGLSLPLSIVGAMLALLITQSDFGMISLIGLIFLLGLLDKNALLLMDYANLLRKSGMNRTEALVKTGMVRMRPILMTTASTILGMLPIALGLGAGAELRQPMAVAIIGGLITSTLLSLIVVPVLYSLLDDFWVHSLKRRRFG